MFKPALVLLLCAPLCATATPAALSLQESFDAYARIITQNDENARTVLRNSLNTADPIQYPDLSSIVDTLYAFENFSAGFEEPAASAIGKRRKTIHCRADKVEESDAHDRGMVDYHCTLPDVSAAFGAYRDTQARYKAGEQSDEGAKAFLQTYAATLRDAPDTRYEARAEFSRVGDNGPWSSTDMMFLGLELLKQLMPFEAWDERVEADAVSAY